MRELVVLLAFALLPIGAARAQFCPGVTPWVFDDVQASDPFCGVITWMAANNVTLGCQTIDGNHRLYCPDAFVTRKQMAAFMKRQADAVVHAAHLHRRAGDEVERRGLGVCRRQHRRQRRRRDGDQRAGGDGAAGEPEPDRWGGVDQSRAGLPAAARLRDGQVPRATAREGGPAAPTTPAPAR